MIYQSVCYHDASGFQVAGYIRCSRLIKRAPFDDGSESVAAADLGPANKKCKTTAQVPLTASNIAAASSSSGLYALGAPPTPQYSASLSVSHNGSNGMVGAEYPHEDRHQHIDAEEEFVCAIRPVDASFPHAGGSQLFSSLLSTASIVAHDLDLRSNNSDFPFQPSNSNPLSNPLPLPLNGNYDPQLQAQSQQSHSQHTQHTHSASYPPHDQPRNPHNPHPPQSSYPPQGAYPSPMYAPLSGPLTAPLRNHVQVDKYLEGVGVQDDQPL